MRLGYGWRTRVTLVLCVLANSSCGNRQEIEEHQAEIQHGRDLYLGLMKLPLTDLVYENDPEGRDARRLGKDWPSRGYTMIGMKRLDNLRFCVEDVLERNIPGDFLEAGAWRGGATIFMRSILKAHGVTDRKVWVADSFEGLPPSNPEKYPADEGWDLSGIEELAVDIDTVKKNFDRYGLLDDQVVFLKGWFKDTFPDAPIESLAILRVDADLYESTMDALKYLYDKVSEGGYIIIDDYGLLPCAKAVQDFRAERGIDSELMKIDWTGRYWMKGGPPKAEPAEKAEP